jgi:hypothetical protein
MAASQSAGRPSFQTTAAPPSLFQRTIGFSVENLPVSPAKNRCGDLPKSHRRR